MTWLPLKNPTHPGPKFHLVFWLGRRGSIFKKIPQGRISIENSNYVPKPYFWCPKKDSLARLGDEWRTVNALSVIHNFFKSLYLPSLKLDMKMLLKGRKNMTALLNHQVFSQLHFFWRQPIYFELRRIGGTLTLYPQGCTPEWHPCWWSSGGLKGTPSNPLVAPLLSLLLHLCTHTTPLPPPTASLWPRA